MADVFISYARATIRQAQAAAAGLRALGYTVWLDEDLPVHRAYSRVIEEQLAAARAALVLWSPDAVVSEWVMSEADRARSEKKLVQAMLEEVRLPMPFDQIQCADLRGWQGEADARGWKAALASIAELVGAREPAGARSPERRAVVAAASAEGERRHLTILNCLLVREPTSPTEPDPEDWRAVVGAFRASVERLVGQYGGHLSKLGEQASAYFGYPEALEDAAERAVKAGLAIVDATKRFASDAERRYGVKVRVQAGVHSGTVVVAQERGEPAIYGDAARLAELAASAAGPESLVVTAAARELVQGLFTEAEAGFTPAEGAQPALRLYRLVGGRPESRLSRGPVRSVQPTPFVGREEELSLLASRWARARDGHGQLVLLFGEPGIGKSRLIEEFRSRIASDPHDWIECAGEPLFLNTPFHATRQVIDQVLGVAHGEGAADSALRLNAALTSAGLDAGEATPLISEMLGLTTPEGFPALALAPEQQRQRLLAILAEWVLSAARRHPLVLVVEDLQWVDPSTFELIDILVEQCASGPLMLLGTARPEFRPAWPARGHQAQITLSRLSSGESRDLVERALRGAGLGADTVEEVVRRTDGVPLYAEEVMRLILEKRGGPSAVPATLLDSLTARLDRLGRAKETAQLASVIGREFTYALLRAVAPLPEETLQAHLAELARADLIQVRGVPPSAAYRFRHALIQDAAYETLLKSARRDLHGRVARAVVERFPDLAEAQPEVIAVHFTRAGEALLAMGAWKRAGDAAYARRAFKEAEAAYREGVQAAEVGPQGAERDAKELELWSGLNRVLQLTKGYAAPETVEAAGRARALAEKSGTLSQLIREEARLWRAIITSGDYAAASALADHILELSGADGRNPARLVFAYNAQVQTRFYTGDLAGVEEYFEKLSPLLDTVGGRQAPGNNIVAIGVASLNAWALGREHLSRERIGRALAVAEGSKDPYDTAMALHFLGNLCALQRDPERAEAVAQKLLDVARENGFTYVISLAASPLGWARAQRGAAAESVAAMRAALAEQVESGARIALTNWLNRLAEAQLCAGAMREALDTIAQSLIANPQERIFRPESLRIRGLVQQQLGDRTAAAADFLEAIALAKRLGARAWELRAAVSLARLRLDANEGAGVRDLLDPLVASVEDGSPSRDAREARALLADLRSRSELGAG